MSYFSASEFEKIFLLSPHHGESTTFVKGGMRDLYVLIILLLLPIFYPNLGYSQKIDKNLYSFIDWQIGHRAVKVKIDYLIEDELLKTSTGKAIKLRAVKVTVQNSDKIEKFIKDQFDDKNVILIVDSREFDVTADVFLGLIFYRDKTGKIRCLNWELSKRGITEIYLAPDEILCIREKWQLLTDAVDKSAISDFYFLAERSLAEGFEEDALKFLQEGVRKFESEIGFYEKIADIYRLMDLPGFELDAYLACLEKNPDYIPARRQLALVYEKMAATVPKITQKKYLQEAIRHWEFLAKQKQYKKEAEEHLVKILLAE